MPYRLVDGQIDIAEWSLFGEGATAQAYNCDGDDSVMLKLYDSSIGEDVLVKEKTMTDELKKEGINVPAFIKIVHWQNRAGGIFERITGKRSFSSLLSDENEDFEENVKRFSLCCKHLHEMTLDRKHFPSKKEEFLSLVNKSSFIVGGDKEKIVSFINSIPDESFALHGDLHTGNIVDSDNGIYVIDVSDFGYGYPLLDIGALYFCTMISGQNGGSATKIFHLDKNKLADVWKLFAKHYADADNEEKLADFTEKVKPYSLLFIIKRALDSGLRGSLKIGYEIALKSLYSK